MKAWPLPALVAAAALSACEHPKPATFQDVASNPANVRTSVHEVDPKIGFDRVGELAKLCWDDDNMPAGEKAMRTTGLIVAAILVGPAAGTLQRRRVATVQFDDEGKKGIVMLRLAGQGQANLGAIIETRPVERKTELRVVLQGEVDKMHDIAQRWMRGERVCTGLTDREVK